MVAHLLYSKSAALKAVQKVETAGKGGFIAPGMPTIPFEKRIFWKQLKKRAINSESYLAGHENILSYKWKRGSYQGVIGEYDRLEQAHKINCETVDASASWGMFQVIRFHYAAYGEASVESFVSAMCESEFKQLILSARFIKLINLRKITTTETFPALHRIQLNRNYEIVRLPNRRIRKQVSCAGIYGK